jgi:hypothetical protein
MFRIEVENLLAPALRGGHSITVYKVPPPLMETIVNFQAKEIVDSPIPPPPPLADTPVACDQAPSPMICDNLR